RESTAPVLRMQRQDPGHACVSLTVEISVIRTGSRMNPEAGLLANRGARFQSGSQAAVAKVVADVSGRSAGPLRWRARSRAGTIPLRYGRVAWPLLPDLPECQTARG